MSIWDQPGVAPKPRDFVQFETPGASVQGIVVDEGVKNWPAKTDPRTGAVVPAKQDPEFVLEQDNDEGEVTLTAGQWKLRQLLFDGRLTVGDWVGVRYIGKMKGSNSKDFEVLIRKGVGLERVAARRAAQPPENAPAQAPGWPAPQPPAAARTMTVEQMREKAAQAAQAPAAPAPAAPADPWTTPQAPADPWTTPQAQAQPPLAPTGTDGAPW